MWLWDKIKEISSGLLRSEAKLENRLTNFNPSIETIKAIAPNIFRKETWYTDTQTGVSVIKETKVIEFDDEETMKRAVYLYGHFNKFGSTLAKLLGDKWYVMTIHDFGKNERGKYFIEIDFLGDGEDYAEKIRKEQEKDSE